MEHVKVFKVGTNVEDKVIALSKSLDDLLSLASQKLGISAQRIFTIKGCEIDDINLIRDNDILYISTGEPFQSLKNTSVPVEAGPENAMDALILQSHSNAAKICGLEINLETVRKNPELGEFLCVDMHGKSPLEICNINTDKYAVYVKFFNVELRSTMLVFLESREKQ